jgi:hypothetical protein
MSRLQNIGGEVGVNQLSQCQAGSCSLFLYNQTVAGRVSKITTADRSRSLKKIFKRRHFAMPSNDFISLSTTGQLQEVKSFKFIAIKK